MATMTVQDLLNLQNQNPWATRQQLAAIWQQQQATGTPPPGRPDVSGTMVVNPPPANYGPPATNPSPTPPPPTSPTGTPTNASAKAFFDQLFPGQTLSPEMLMANKDVLAAHGITLKLNAEGQATHITLPDGTIIDPIIDAGGANQKSWQINSGPGGDTTGFGGGSSGIGTGSLGYGLGSGANYGPWTAPWTGQWQAPTAEQALQSPGVQFALNNSLRVMENNAAAQGVLGNARAQEAISQNLGQQLLGNYNQIYGQALTSYQQNQADFFANQDRPFTKNLQVAQNVGLPAVIG